MRHLALVFLISILIRPTSAQAQPLNWEDRRFFVATGADYLTTAEKEMIDEVNRVRTNPPLYAKLVVQDALESARKRLNEFGKGPRNYSLYYHYTDNKVSEVDTIWHYKYEEDVHALQTLYDTLNRLKPLSLLRPDRGIYKACVKHAKDQAKKQRLDHQGTDGSWPWDRITKAAPNMRDGNENIAYNSDDVNARVIVMQLLVDAGISDYGHRYNLLDPKWTHVICYATKPPLWKQRWWLQNFGVEK